MATERRRLRCRERLERLSDSTLDASSLQLEVIAELRRAIGFDRWCWPVADPETLIPLSGVAEHDYGPQAGGSLALESRAATTRRCTWWRGGPSRWQA